MNKSDWKLPAIFKNGITFYGSSTHSRATALESWRLFFAILELSCPQDQFHSEEQGASSHLAKGGQGEQEGGPVQPRAAQQTTATGWWYSPAPRRAASPSSNCSASIAK